MDLQQIDQFRTTYIEFCKQKEAKLLYEEENLKNLSKKMESLAEQKAKMLKAQATVDKMIQIVSAKGIGKIESVVSGGLRLVFGNKVSFIIDKKEGTRGTNYKILFKKGDVIGEPLENFGGGLVNVAAFLLRVIMIKRFKMAKFIAVDESFNNVSVEYLPKVSKMLKTLCDDHGFKILAVTHQSQLSAVADRTYRVSVVDGVSTATEIDKSELEIWEDNASSESKVSTGNPQKT